MTSESDKPSHSLRAAIILTAVVGTIFTAIVYLGVLRNTRTSVAPPAVPAGAAQLVDTIVLPHDEQELPSGPNQRTFITSCTICHSTRLVMTQPAFPRKQWAEVVHKMVKTYGAPITPDGEEQIVDYLATVRGN